MTFAAFTEPFAGHPLLQERVLSVLQALPSDVQRDFVDDPRFGTAKYIIAHEFAHAFLRNGGWGEITDAEEAADALAASWGFHKPATFS